MRSHPFAHASTAVFALAVLALACSETPRWTGSVQMRDGVEVVSNPRVPLLERAPVTLTELWSVQGGDWMDPTRVHAQGDLLAVVDPPANQVHLVSASGKVGASVGRPGGGPGEFLRLLDAFPDGDRLVVLDGGKSSVEVLDLDGAYRSSVYIEGQGWAGFLLAGGALLVQGEFLSDPARESRGDWVRVAEGTHPRAFTSLPLDSLPEEQGVQCSDFSPWAGGAARMRFTTPRIEVFDPTGGLQREIRVDLPIEVVSDSERDSALSQLRRWLVGRGLPPEFVEQNLVVMEERWKVKCRFGPLRTEPSGRLAAFLEQNPDEFGSGPAQIHVLSGGGAYLAKVAFPDPWRDFTLDGGVIYALTRASGSDLITLKAYRLDLSDSAFAEAAAVLEEARARAAGVR